MAKLNKAKQLVGRHLPLTFRPDKELTPDDVRAPCRIGPLRPQFWSSRTQYPNAVRRIIGVAHNPKLLSIWI